MEKQHKSTILSLFGDFSIRTLIVFVLLFVSCKRDLEASHHLYLHNSTNKIIEFHTKRDTSVIFKVQLPPLSKVLMSDGGEHHHGDDIIFKMIREDFGWSGDTVKFYHNGNLLIRWGAPLRLMPDSINHFYNESSWEIRKGGIKNRRERGTFTIYESDLGNIEGK